MCAMGGSPFTRMYTLRGRLTRAGAVAHARHFPWLTIGTKHLPLFGVVVHLPWPTLAHGHCGLQGRSPSDLSDVELGCNCTLGLAPKAKVCLRAEGGGAGLHRVVPSSNVGDSWAPELAPQWAPQNRLPT